MAVDALMTVQSIDFWYQRAAGNESDTPVAQFYGKHFDDAYMEHRFQSMTMNPQDASRV